jgi:hypothetical protein
MASNGMTPPTASEPFRQAVLNDEFYAAHWLRRELAYRKQYEGFNIFHYDSIRKFNSISTDEAIVSFLRGRGSPGEGYDALLLNEPRDIGVRPDHVFEDSGRSKYFLYLRRSNPPSLRPEAADGGALP